MLPLPSGGATGSFDAALENEAATQRLAVDIAQAVEPGTLITLSGDLGAGKTTFARALIRVLAGNPSISVPSPTFTIVQTYDLPRFTVVHADFYRLASPDELTELGLDDIPEDAVMLVEWPDRAGDTWPADRIDLSFTLSPEHDLTYRNARVTGFGAQAGRIARIGLLRSFLQNAGYAEAERRHMQGDASSRSYELLMLEGRSSVLMNAPRRPDGPPVRGNKPYSAIAHLAEDVKPFVAMARGLRARGFSAPDILAADLENG
jgi:tRNA threonylcarbamoyl adenosine modification protein YjeE